MKSKTVKVIVYIFYCICTIYSQDLKLPKDITGIWMVVSDEKTIPSDTSDTLGKPDAMFADVSYKFNRKSINKFFESIIKIVPREGDTLRGECLHAYGNYGNIIRVFSKTDSVIDVAFTCDRFNVGFCKINNIAVSVFFNETFVKQMGKLSTRLRALMCKCK